MSNNQTRMSVRSILLYVLHRYSFNYARTPLVTMSACRARMDLQRLMTALGVKVGTSTTCSRQLYFLGS